MSESQVAGGIELRDITKRFGSLLANARVCLRVEPGSVHGIVGENGAGKSTAMQILFGLLQPDSGAIYLGGRRQIWRSPADAIVHRIGMVHQHFMLAGPHSALDNVLLGAEPARWGFITRRQARTRLEELAVRYGLPVEWDEPVADLPVGVRQRIEILKLLYREAEILILDEPTAVLTPMETESLFSNLRKLCQEGKTVLVVTHKLKEVMAFTDRVTVFRAGRVVGEFMTSQTTPQQLAELMVGRKVNLDANAQAGRPPGATVLEVEDLRVKNGNEGGRELGGLTLSVKEGEIVGIAGVDGNGQSEFLRAILQPRELRKRLSGAIRILGHNVTGWRAGKIRELGVAVVPEDRQCEGLLLDRPLDENFLLGRQREAAFCRGGVLRIAELRRATAQALLAGGVNPAEPDFLAGQLSGGNQQKLILARELDRRPRLIVADHPCRGVDIGAMESIRGRLRIARDEGAGVLLVSSDLDEILALSDRILAFFEGCIAGEFLRGEASERELGLRMGGA